MEKTTRGAGIACSGYANCYVGCSCNTSNGWYSSCQGTDCKSVTDTRYTGVNAMSASNVGDVTSLTGGVSTQSAGGNIQVVSLSGGVSTMSSSGATTCYKKKTCEEGGYLSSKPDGKTCDTVKYNGYTCYTNCRNSNYGFTMTVACGGRLSVSVELKNDDTGDILADYSFVQCNVGNNVSTDEEHFFKGNIIKTYQVPAGTYTASVHTYYYYPKPGASAGYACQNAGSKDASKTVTVPGSTGVIVLAPACYGEEGDGGLKPME